MKPYVANKQLSASCSAIRVLCIWNRGSFGTLGKWFAITYTKVQTVRTVSNEIELLSLRSKLASTDICDICSHHEQEYLHKYSVLQRKCCNVFDQHKDCKPRTKSLREITSKCRASALKSGHLPYSRRQTLLIVQDTLTEIVCPSSWRVPHTCWFTNSWSTKILFERRAPFVCFHRIYFWWQCCSWSRYWGSYSLFKPHSSETW